jgi:hypothetical protein
MRTPLLLAAVQHHLREDRKIRRGAEQSLRDPASAT